MESDNTRHACVYTHSPLHDIRFLELSPLEIQTLNLVLQGRGLQGEFCHAIVGVAVKAWYGTGERNSTASVPRIP